MPRQLRIQYPGAIYHVLSRGDRREDIFLDDVDRQDFLKTLAEACQKTGFQVPADCLMRNHLNPVRAGLLKSEDRLTAYPWNSLGWYAAAREHRPTWLRVDRLLGEHGIGDDTAAGREEFERRMEGRRAAEEEEEALASDPPRLVPGKRGIQAPDAGANGRPAGRTPCGRPAPGTGRGPSRTDRGGGIVGAGLDGVGLGLPAQACAGKLALAARLRRETTTPLKWIAARVRLGTSKTANSNLHRWMKANAKPRGEANIASVERKAAPA
jgi:hypothetical protein